MGNSTHINMGILGATPSTAVVLSSVLGLQDAALAPATPARRSWRALYREVFDACMEAITQRDVPALDGLIESEVLHHIASEDIPLLWEACCHTWPESCRAERQGLGVVMALMKSWFPNLSNPAWVADIDPETL